VAGGDYFTAPGFQAFVIEQKDGVWGSAQPIPGMAAIDGGSGSSVNSISCASPGNCAVAGEADVAGTASSKVQRGFVVSEANGSWSTPDVLPPPVPATSVGGAVLRSVSCGAPGDCVAGGYDSTAGLATMAIIVEETNGVWGTPAEVAGAAQYDEVNSVSCASPGECVAGLSLRRTGYTAELATESGGTWTAAQPVPGLAGLPGGQQGSMLYSVSCPSAGNCTAAGELGPGIGPLFVVDEKNGSWGDASELAGGAAYGSGGILFDQIPLSCASAGNCAVAGTVHGLGFIASEVNGTWDSESAWGYPALKSGIPGGVTTLSCASPGNCSAGGVVPVGTPINPISPFLIDETNGTWGAATLMSGAGAGSEIVAMSCASADSCVAADAGNPSSTIAQKVPVAPTATAVSLSARSVVYGHEAVQHISVAVSAASGVPTGTVAVRAGTTTVCTITLTGGHGSCALSATRFGAGSVKLTAAYAGPAWFTASISPAAAFTVVKENTRTALHLSAAKIRYGHEQVEKFSVAVTPAYASTAYATGKVTVKAGDVTLCVIVLKADRGSCTLPGKRLQAGTYHPTAVYAGGADFTRSTSSRTTLIVTK
jgi:hypothetical protein